MGNDGFPMALGFVLVAAILGALLACGIIVGQFISATVATSPDIEALVADVSYEVVGDKVILSAAGTDGGNLPYQKYEWDFDYEPGEEAEYEEGESVEVHDYETPYFVKLRVTDGSELEDVVVVYVTDVVEQ